MRYFLAGAAPVLFVIFVASGAARAEDEGAGSTQQSQSESKVKSQSQQKQGRKSKGGRAHDRGEAEGTEAFDRFEANTVVKSQYKLGGEPLEVDPD